jgi:hypothetical protein
MPFAQRRPKAQPEPGQSIFAGRDKEIALYRLHFHRAKDHPEVRLITVFSGPGGVGKTRLLDELEWYRPAQTIYSRIDGSADLGHDATQLLRAIADGLHRAGEPIPTPEFDQLYDRRQLLLEKALTRTSDAKQVLRHYYRPALLGLDSEQFLFTPDLEAFAELRWNDDELNLAFGHPIELMTKALVTDFNQALDGGTIVTEAIEGEDGRPSEAAVTARADKIVLMFDDFDRLSPAIAEWLLVYLLGHARAAIRCDLRLVIAGREELLQTADNRWAVQFADVTLSLPLRVFSSAEVADFIDKNSAVSDESVVKKVGQATDRLPLWLNLWLVSGADPDPAGRGVALGQGFSEAERSWLESAALAGSFDQPRLTSLVGEEMGRSAFQWLAGQPMLIEPWPQSC